MKNSRRFARVLKASRGKRQRIRNRQAGLLRNTSKKPLHRTASRLKKARNNQMSRRRMRTIPENENEKENKSENANIKNLISGLKSMKMRGGSAGKRCGY